MFRCWHSSPLCYLVGQKVIETDFQTALSNRAVALRPLLDIRGLSRSHTCPWQLFTIQLWAARIPSLSARLAGQKCGSLVGWSADWLALEISIQVMPYCARGVQDKGLIRDAKRQAWVFHRAKTHCSAGWACPAPDSVSQCLLVYCAMKWSECVWLCQRSNANNLPVGKTHFT